MSFQLAAALTLSITIFFPLYSFYAAFVTRAESHSNAVTLLSIRPQQIFAFPKLNLVIAKMSSTPELGGTGFGFGDGDTSNPFGVFRMALEVAAFFKGKEDEGPVLVKLLQEALDLTQKEQSE